MKNLALLALALAPSVFAATPRYPTVPNQYLVVLKPGATQVSALSTLHVLETVSEARREYVVELKPSAITTMQRNPLVDFIEPVYIYRARPRQDALGEANPVQSAPVNDPMYSSLWGLMRIDAPKAWGQSVGSNTGALVAVIDTGIDYTHPDLKTNVPTKGFSAITGKPDGMDDNSHGSHVAGTIGAVGNNSVGVVGVNQKANLVASKFLDAQGSGTSVGAIRAVDWAVAQGARVLNNSWGGGGPSKALERAVKRACDANAVFVAAAGNENNDNDRYPSYPASYKLPCVVSVAATGQNDEFASFSNFGKKTVHVAAPGVGILSTIPGGRYDTYSGTSMATPHVSGALALLLTKNPKLTNTQAIEKLQKTTDALPCKAKCVKYGRINVGKLLQ